MGPRVFIRKINIKQNNLEFYIPILKHFAVAFHKAKTIYILKSDTYEELNDSLFFLTFIYIFNDGMSEKIIIL